MGAIFPARYHRLSYDNRSVEWEGRCDIFERIQRFIIRKSRCDGLDKYRNDVSHLGNASFAKYDYKLWG